MSKDEPNEEQRKAFAALVACRDQVIASIRDNEKAIERIRDEGPTEDGDQEIISVVCDFALAEFYLGANMSLE